MRLNELQERINVSREECLEAYAMSIKGEGSLTIAHTFGVLDGEACAMILVGETLKSDMQQES